MGGGSPQEENSAEFSRLQAGYANRLADISFPQLQDLLSRVGRDLSGGPNAIPPSVAGAFSTARAGVNADFDMLGGGTKAMIAERAKTSGQIYSDQQVSTAQLDAARALDTQRNTAMRQLDLQEAGAGLNEFNTLMDLLGSGAGTALGLGAGGAGNAAAALRGFSNVSPLQGALGGAATGASLGSYAGGYGALIGGILGAAGGYYSAAG